MSTPSPRRIEWAGPENWTVWADEDGVHIRSATGAALEMPDVERLFEVWQHAKDATACNHITAPTPMTPEQAREARYHRAEEDASRRAVRAIKAEFSPHVAATTFQINAPF